MTAAAASPWVLPRPAGRIPFLLRALLFAMIATSSVVMIEPAPTDAFFPLCLVVALLSGYPLIVGGFQPLMHGGLFVFVAANLWTIPGADGVSDAIRFAVITFYMLALWMMLASVVSVHGMRAVRVLVFSLWVAAGIATGVALLARFHLIPNSERFYLDEFGLRIKSTFKDPNVFGPFLVSAIVLMIVHLLHGARRVALCITVLLAFASGLLLAFSRGAYVNLAVCLAALLFAEFAIVRDLRVMGRIVGLGVPVLVLSALGLAVLLTQAGLDTFFSDRLSFQNYDSDRFNNQFNALMVAVDNPMGIGPGQWEFPRYAFATHNLYIRVLVETGWIGLLAFLAFVAGTIWAAVRGIQRNSRFVGVHVGSFAILVGTFFESIVIDTLHWRHLFLVMALSVGLDAYEQRND